MNLYYAKTLLYAYKSLTAVAEQIDELVEKKALSSMTNFSPALSQCEKIVDFTFQKDVLFALRIVMKEVFDKFSEDEMKYFSYKYLKDKPKSYFGGFDFSSRKYFRTQIRLAKKFAEKMEKKGVTDYWFEQNCLEIEFFRELLKRVIEREKALIKKSECKTSKNTVNKDVSLKKSA